MFQGILGGDPNIGQNLKEYKHMGSSNYPLLNFNC